MQLVLLHISCILANKVAKPLASGLSTYRPREADTSHSRLRSSLSCKDASPNLIFGHNVPYVLNSSCSLASSTRATVHSSCNYFLRHRTKGAEYCARLLLNDVKNSSVSRFSAGA